MKKRNKILIFSLILFILLILTSCSDIQGERRVNTVAINDLFSPEMHDIIVRFTIEKENLDFDLIGNIFIHRLDGRWFTDEVIALFINGMEVELNGFLSTGNEGAYIPLYYGHHNFEYRILYPIEFFVNGNKSMGSIRLANETVITIYPEIFYPNRTNIVRWTRMGDVRIQRFSYSSCEPHSWFYRDIPAIQSSFNIKLNSTSNICNVFVGNYNYFSSNRVAFLTYSFDMKIVSHDERDDNVNTVPSEDIFIHYKDKNNIQISSISQIGESENVIVIIFDVTSRVIRKLEGRSDETIVWNGTDYEDNQVPNGIYYFILKSDDFVDIRRFMIFYECITNETNS